MLATFYKTCSRSRSKLSGSLNQYLSTKTGGRVNEIWRDEATTTDNSMSLPKVVKRDGTIGEIDKNRGFVDYHRISEPYRFVFLLLLILVAYYLETSVLYYVLTYLCISCILEIPSTEYLTGTKSTTTHPSMTRSNR